MNEGLSTPFDGHLDYNRVPRNPFAPRISGAVACSSPKLQPARPPLLAPLVSSLTSYKGSRTRDVPNSLATLVLSLPRQ